jgi:uncharacterized membrane protein YkvA (DUF1232 family)
MKETLIEFVQAIPATGRLVYRVLRDDRVDEKRRAVAMASLGYVLLPFDLIPDRIPLIGKIDDVVVVAAAFQALFEAAGDEVLAEHWEGSEGGLEALLSLVEMVGGFMPRQGRRLLRLNS